MSDYSEEFDKLRKKAEKPHQGSFYERKNI